MNLVPLDAAEIWDEETKTEVHEMLDRMMEGFTFTCMTEFTIHDTLFAQTFDAKDKLLGTIKFRFKNRMLKEEICVEDREVLEKLKKIVINDAEKLENPKTNLKERNEKVAVEQKSVEPKITQEKWKQLSWNSNHDVILTKFIQPESFLAVLEKPNKNLAKNLEKVDKERILSSPEINGNCGVEINNEIHRGKIMKIIESIAEVLLVDAGEIVQCEKSNLIELPTEAITEIPFQSVHCRMLGIRPKYNMNFWPAKQRQAVENLMKNRKLKFFVTETNQIVDDFTKIGMKFYDVFVIDRENGNYLDDLAVEAKIADRVENLKKPYGDEDSGNVSDEENDANILYKLLKQKYQGLSEDVEEDLDDEFEHEKVRQEDESQQKIIEIPKDLPSTTLEYLHKHPNIEWRQNSSVIYLLISAIDCEEYALRISDESLEVTIKYKEKTEKAFVKFYSLIDSKLCSHEKRGLNVIVRLLKRNNREWPRLTESRERSQFIKYSEEEIQKSKYAGCKPYLSDDEFDEPETGAEKEDSDDFGEEAVESFGSDDIEDYS